MRSVFLARLLALFALCGVCGFSPATAHAQTFTNPIFTSQDPWVLNWRGVYYYSESNGRSILVRSATTLTGLASATPKTVWSAPDKGPNSQNVWAPELHNVGGQWYLYYAADDGNNANHRLYVLQAKTSDPLGSYITPSTGYLNGQLHEASDCWAIDPNVFTASDGRLYIVWSGWPVGGTTQNIYLAALKDATHLGGSRVLIATPTEPWETRTAPIAEGPVGYTHNGMTYITYSGSASWTTDYTVGLLTNATGKILDAASWVKSGPILDHHNKAYGPGSVVFTPSPDGTETWMLYHGIESPNSVPSYSSRDLRMQSIAWNDDGTPLLGYPYDPSVPLFVPSGENGPYGWGASRSGIAAQGTWQNIGLTSAQSTADGTTWHSLFHGPGNLYDFMVAADVQWVASGKGDGVPRYGLYAPYTDANNHVEVFLDRANRVLSTHAVVGGKEQGWQTSALATGFDFAKFHTLLVTRADGAFRFLVDGVVMQQRRIGLGEGQIGLVADGTQANYKNLHLANNAHGWGDAFGDAAEGDLRDGLRTPGWALQGAAGANGLYLGAGWSQVFRGNPNLASYTLSADVAWVKTGATAQFPKYGLYAAYLDAGNHVEVFIDRQYGVLATHAVIHGVDQGWQNAKLPVGFVPGIAHNLKVTKRGTTFTFYLDSVPLQQRGFNIENGQIGLVTEDTQANYRNVIVTP